MNFNQPLMIYDENVSTFKNSIQTKLKVACDVVCQGNVYVSG